MQKLTIDHIAKLAYVSRTVVSRVLNKHPNVSAEARERVMQVIKEYNYSQGGRSATVGPIYRHEGTGAFPDIFQDKIFVFDWSRRWIKWADVQEATFVTKPEEDFKHDPLNVAMPAKRLVDVKLFDQLTITTPISMELGPDGSLYVAEFDGFWVAGPNARVTRYRWVTEDE